MRQRQCGESRMFRLYDRESWPHEERREVENATASDYEPYHYQLSDRDIERIERYKKRLRDKADRGELGKLTTIGFDEEGK
jgi:hypothetical protein